MQVRKRSWRGSGGEAKKDELDTNWPVETSPIDVTHAVCILDDREEGVSLPLVHIPAEGPRVGRVC